MVVERGRGAGQLQVDGGFGLGPAQQGLQVALERLLAMTLGFAILLDPAAVLRAGQAVEETIDGVIREMAGV